MKPVNRSMALRFSVIVAALVIGSFFVLYDGSTPSFQTTPGLDTFDSYEELSSYIEDSLDSRFGNSFGGGDVAFRTLGSTDGLQAAPTSESAPAAASSSAPTNDYSRTNVQVKGVDEADIVKTNGKTIFVASGDTVFLVSAVSAGEQKIISNISFSSVITELYLREDSLVVLYSSYEEREDCPLDRPCLTVGGDLVSRLEVFDVTDPVSPEKIHEVVVDGSMSTSRMIDGVAYVVSTKYISGPNPVLPVHYVDDVAIDVEASSIRYPDYRDFSYSFSIVSAFDIATGEFESATYLLGSSHTVYVSENALYLTQEQPIAYESYVKDIIDTVYRPLLPEYFEKSLDKEGLGDESSWQRMELTHEAFNQYLESLSPSELQRVSEELEERLDSFEADYSKKQQTFVYKVSLDGLELTLEGSGSFPGRLLNQFSLDEHKGHLRVATTTGNSWWGRGTAPSLNHMYILDEDLRIVGTVEDLAPGERIYSARFAGDTAYMVTYRQVDPLFVIDVSNPTRPSVLGYLKISGYSDYLQPYDENHLIGIGRETEVVGENRVVNKGLKITLFDVSDFENPKEVSTVEIGDQYTSSDALWSHKAVLFDRDKNLLVIPVQINNYAWQSSDTVEGVLPGESWNGVYVFSIDETGIAVRDRITHGKFFANEESSYQYSYAYAVKRGLYIADVLYTVSEMVVKAHDLSSLDYISQVQLREEPYQGGYYAYGGDVSFARGGPEPVLLA